MALHALILMGAQEELCFLGSGRIPNGSNSCSGRGLSRPQVQRGSAHCRAFRFTPSHGRSPIGVVRGMRCARGMSRSVMDCSCYGSSSPGHTPPVLRKPSALSSETVPMERLSHYQELQGQRPLF